MCGIAGSLRFDSNPVDLGAIRNASEAIRHRGPDDYGYAGWAPGRAVRETRDIEELAGSSLVLAHRRLAILELSEAGWQPMGTPDGRHFISFNGEIYNYLELGRALEAEGVRITSHSDTEVLLKGLVRWGTDLLPRLVGMFAFAYADLDRERLLLVRDFFGIKPLYYALAGGALHFASEIKGLLRMPDIQRHINAREFHPSRASGDLP